MPEFQLDSDLSAIRNNSAGIVPLPPPRFAGASRFRAGPAFARPTNTSNRVAVLRSPMRKASRARCLYLSWLSRPKFERRLYRLLQRRRVARIVELGISSQGRTENLLLVAARYHGDGDVHYAGFDLFETRPSDQPPLSLIGVHRALSPLGVALRLVPGEVGAAVERTANMLAATDLMLISACIPPAGLQRVWPFLPRMLHTDSVVLREEIGKDGQTALRAVAVSEIEARATAARSFRRVA